MASRAITSFLGMMKDKKKKKKKGDDITEAMRGSVSNQFGKYGSPGLYCNFSDCRADMTMMINDTFRERKRQMCVL